MTVIDGTSNTATSLKVGDADGIAIDPKAARSFYRITKNRHPNCRRGYGRSHKVAVGAHIWGMAFDESTSTLFLTHTAAGEIVALDEKTHAVSKIAVGKILVPWRSIQNASALRG